MTWASCSAASPGKEWEGHSEVPGSKNCWRAMAIGTSCTPSCLGRAVSTPVGVQRVLREPCSVFRRCAELSCSEQRAGTAWV